MRLGDLPGTELGKGANDEDTLFELGMDEGGEADRDAAVFDGFEVKLHFIILDR